MTEGSYIYFGVENVPYSQVRVDLTGALEDEGLIIQAVHLARVLADEYRDTFYGVAPQQQDAQPLAREPLPAADHPNAPGNGPSNERPRAQQPNAVSARRNEGRQSSDGVRHEYGGAVFICTEHNAELRPSIKNKTMDWEETLQMEVPASWFHTKEDGGTCSVYRSKAQIRLPESVR